MLQEIPPAPPEAAELRAWNAGIRRRRGEMTLTDKAAAAPAGVALGIRANLNQFLLLILLNAFVGGMVGLERTVVPLIGSETFHLASATHRHRLHRQLRHRERV